MDPFELSNTGSATRLNNISSSEVAFPTSASSVGRTSMIQPPATRDPTAPSITPIRRSLVTSYTFPTTSNYDPWSAVRIPQELEVVDCTSLLPLQYASVDEHASTFRLQAPFIYTTKTSNLPRYQLQAESDWSGKPSKLNIRRLRPRETRSCSVPAIHTARSPHMRYNEDDTLYSMTSFDMRSQRPSSLAGSIQMTSGKTLWGGQWTRFWHVTKPHDHAHGSEVQSRSSQTRHRESCELDKRLLFAVKKGVWEDAEGMIVAREEKGSWTAWSPDRLLARQGSKLSASEKVLEMMDGTATDAEKRDLIVSCWVMRIWLAEGFSWEGNVKG